MRSFSEGLMSVRILYRIAAVLLASAALVAVLLSRPAFSAPDPPAAKQVSGHRLRYLVSLPEGWRPGRRFPAVVVIESANRDFAANLDAFVKARGSRPFLLLAPFVVTNGGAQYRSVPTYPYSASDFAAIEEMGPFAFDSSGIAAMMAEARTTYGAEDKYFLTGWEAGGHTVWALLFQHPEAIRAAALSTPNYQGRWMEAGFSRSAARSTLPVQVLKTEDETSAGLHRLLPQIDDAVDAARAHGFNNVTVKGVHKPHGPMAGEVLEFFATFLARQ
jgi:poly(3-hydroxybutyrate) depolymerase